MSFSVLFHYEAVVISSEYHVVLFEKVFVFKEQVVQFPVPSFLLNVVESYLHRNWNWCSVSIPWDHEIIWKIIHIRVFLQSVHRFALQYCFLYMSVKNFCLSGCNSCLNLHYDSAYLIWCNSVELNSEIHASFFKAWKSYYCCANLNSNMWMQTAIICLTHFWVICSTQYNKFLEWKRLCYDLPYLHMIAKFLLVDELTKYELRLTLSRCILLSLNDLVKSICTCRAVLKLL